MKHHLSSLSPDPYFETYKTLYECRHFTFSRLDFHLRGQTNVAWHMYNYVLKHPFRQHISKQTYRNAVFRDYIMTLALYTVQCT